MRCRRGTSAPNPATSSRRTAMGIGASVFMLAAGAIIAFAFNIRVGWLDLDIVGWVLMAVGAFGVILSLTMLGRRRTTVVETPPPVNRPATTQRGVQETSPDDADRPL